MQIQIYVTWTMTIIALIVVIVYNYGKVIIMNDKFLFVSALSDTRGEWSVSNFDAEKAEVVISTEFSDDMTFGEAKEIVKESIQIFRKYGFKVFVDYESEVDRPVLVVIFP